MNCAQLQEQWLANPVSLSAVAQDHLAGCAACAEKVAALAATMSLLDEWETPEPSPYFNTRLQAALRAEGEMAARGRFAWLRPSWLPRPAFTAAFALMLAIGAGLYHGSPEPGASPSTATPGIAATTPAIYDLRALENNHQLLADFDVLDDLNPDDDTATP